MALVFSLFSVNFLPYNVLYYFLIYTFINIGIFAIISALSRNPSYDETLESIKGLAKSNPYIAFSFSVLMLSSAGIPPLAGFFIKYSVLVVLIQNGSYILPIIAIIASVISSFYYLKIIKVMYFEEQSKEFALNAKQSKTPLFIKLLILSAIIVNVTFIFV
jgi:NADH-quinone oxidoreductase subunit N